MQYVVEWRKLCRVEVCVVPYPGGKWLHLPDTEQFLNRISSVNTCLEQTHWTCILSNFSRKKESRAWRFAVVTPDNEAYISRGSAWKKYSSLSDNLQSSQHEQEPDPRCFYLFGRHRRGAGQRHAVWSHQPRLRHDRRFDRGFEPGRLLQTLPSLQWRSAAQSSQEDRQRPQLLLNPQPR